MTIQEIQSVGLRQQQGRNVNLATDYGVRIVPARVGAGATYWKVTSVRHLTPEENQGKHNIYVDALDERTQRCREAELRIGWTWEGRREDEPVEPKPLDKPDHEPAGNVDVYSGQQLQIWLEGDGCPSDRVENLHTAHADERAASGEIWNSHGHHSFHIVFQRTQALPIDEGHAGTNGNGQTTLVGSGGLTGTTAVNGATYVPGHDAITDGTQFQPGQRFVQSWTLRNTGTQVWDFSYRLVWIGGSSLGAPAQALVPPCPPGVEVAIPIPFIAPQEPGRYKSVWQLCAPDGQTFGNEVWTEIEVTGAPAVDAKLSASTSQIFTAPANADATTHMLVNTWNRYGGLLQQEAARVGIPVGVAVAILAAESKGEPFDPNGRLIIRFENHIFYQYWGKANEARFRQHFNFTEGDTWKGHQWRPDVNSAWQPMHQPNDQDTEWRVFEFARMLDESAAMLAISMGAPQIMGFNHPAIGYATVQAMFEAFRSDVRAQLTSLFRFMEVNRLVEPVRNGDFFTFAKIYNGAGQAQTYQQIIQDHLAAYQRLTGAPRSVPPALPSAASLPMALPVPVPSGKSLAEVDPDLYAAWRKHMEQGFTNNQLMFSSVLHAFMNPYWTTVWMYRILFGLGIGSFLAAVGLSVLTGQQGFGVIFGTLSAVTFLSYFWNRPLQALEENLQFITWLGIIYNTYWTRLVYAQDAATFQQDAEQITTDTIAKIMALTDKHGERSGTRPTLLPPANG